MENCEWLPLFDKRPKTIHDILDSTGDDLILSTDRGIEIFKTDTLSFEPIQIYDFDMYLTTGSLEAVYDQQTRTIIFHQKPISSMSMLEKKDDILVHSVADGTKKRIDLSQVTGINEVRNLLDSYNGKALIAGTNSLFFIEFETEHVTRIPDTDMVIDGVFDKNGTAWVLTIDGIATINEDNTLSYVLDKSYMPLSGKVGNLTIEDKNVWFTSDNTLHRLDRQLNTIEHMSLPNHIQQINRSTEDVILRDATKTNIIIYDISIHGNTLLLGTSKGLFSYNIQKRGWDVSSRYEYRFDDEIRSVEQTRGKIWMHMSDYGLMGQR